MAIWPKKQFIAFRNRYLPLVKKAIRFPLFETGLQPKIARWQTRKRQVLKSKIKKFAKFKTWTTGFDPRIARWQTRKRSKYWPKAKKLARFNHPPVGNPVGISSLGLLTPKFRKRVIARKGRKKFPYRTRNVGPAAVVPVGQRNWLPVSLAAYTRRGGD